MSEFHFGLVLERFSPSFPPLKLFDKGTFLKRQPSHLLINSVSNAECSHQLRCKSFILAHGAQRCQDLLSPSGLIILFSCHTSNYTLQFMCFPAIDLFLPRLIFDRLTDCFNTSIYSFFKQQIKLDHVCHGKFCHIFQ